LSEAANADIASVLRTSEAQHGTEARIRLVERGVQIGIVWLDEGRRDPTHGARP
jgi:hypothetical protein